jgi:hypothetical protein
LSVIQCDAESGNRDLRISLSIDVVLNLCLLQWVIGAERLYNCQCPRINKCPGRNQARYSLRDDDPVCNPHVMVRLMAGSWARIPGKRSSHKLDMDPHPCLHISFYSDRCCRVYGVKFGLRVGGGPETKFKNGSFRPALRSCLIYDAVKFLGKQALDNSNLHKIRKLNNS